MKQFLFAALGIAGLFICSSAGCKHDDPAPANNGGNTFSSPQSGQWRVTLYKEGSKDETSDFSGYSFDFQSSGVFTASKSGQTTSGTWAQFMDDSRHKLAISINSADHRISELNEDWVVVLSTGSALELQDDNPASGEVLHMNKQ